MSELAKNEMINPSDKDLFPGKWVLYNKDIKVIKPSVVIHSFGRNLEYKEFEIK